MENKIQRSIILYLESKGAYVTNVITAGKSGTHDLLVCHKGKFYSVEVKDKYNKPSPLQDAHSDMIYAAGGTPIMAWSVADVKKII